jgi:hypothetical protein
LTSSSSPDDVLNGVHAFNESGIDERVRENDLKYTNGSSFLIGAIV